jgi:delta(3,5)-delta(2,4)-dienoyl-CoA isomerase
MWHNLSKIFTKLSHDPDVRAIVLTGAGERAFTAGLDVQVNSPSHSNTLHYPI